MTVMPPPPPPPPPPPHTHTHTQHHHHHHHHHHHPPPLLCNNDINPVFSCLHTTRITTRAQYSKHPGGLYVWIVMFEFMFWIANDTVKYHKHRKTYIFTNMCVYAFHWDNPLAQLRGLLATDERYILSEYETGRCKGSAGQGGILPVYMHMVAVCCLSTYQLSNYRLTKTKMMNKDSTWSCP